MKPIFSLSHWLEGMQIRWKIFKLRMILMVETNPQRKLMILMAINMGNMLLFVRSLKVKRAEVSV